MKSRPFDPNWTTCHPSLQFFLENLCANVAVNEARLRARSIDAQGKFESAIKAIILDLCRAHLSDPSIEVGIATGQSSLQKGSRSRYGAKLLSPRTFRAAMQALIECNNVIKTTPHWDDPSGEQSRTARYQASPALLNEFASLGVSATYFCRHQGFEGIRLKDFQKQLVEYGDVQFASEARCRLASINDMLENHWADLALTDQQLSKELVSIDNERDGEAVQSFDFAARTVYRVFNNGDWEQGGRFYGAWWMACPSRLRRHILIDGKRTVEVDYSGLHAAMLFAEASLDVPDDPYARCLGQVGNNEERQLVKRTFNALLNAKSIKALRMIEGYSEKITGCDWDSFKKRIVNFYPEFKSHFGSGVGLRLQRMDSDLAESVMLKFARMGYACLPVHDSFLVHHALQDELIHAMQEAFESKFKTTGKVNFEIGLGEPVEQTGKSLGMDMDDLLSQPSYITRLQEFLENKGRSER